MPVPVSFLSHSKTNKTHTRQGFTLIELSIVLVIIGLIIGGILTGQDLINAAAQRAQIAQVEKYNTAVNTFRNKYGGLPGDLPNPYASQFGFVTRGSLIGQGDGDGMIITNATNGFFSGIYQGCGETAAFWEDLSSAGLIDGTFNTASQTVYASTTDVTKYLPPGKLGQGIYVYVWNGGPLSQGSNTTMTAMNTDGMNYYGISAVASIERGYTSLIATPGINVIQAYNIDKKVDDGLPQSGTIMSLYVNFDMASGGGHLYWAGTTLYHAAPYTSATNGTSTSCFDNSSSAPVSGVATGVAGLPQHYSLEMNGGGAANCALSFRFQ